VGEAADIEGPKEGEISQDAARSIPYADARIWNFRGQRRKRKLREVLGSVGKFCKITTDEHEKGPDVLGPLFFVSREFTSKLCRKSPSFSSGHYGYAGVRGGQLSAEIPKPAPAGDEPHLEEWLRMQYNIFPF